MAVPPFLLFPNIPGGPGVEPPAIDFRRAMPEIDADITRNRAFRGRQTDEEHGP